MDAGMLGSKEHYEVMAQFEKQFSHLRLDRETGEQFKKLGHVYQSGETNELFRAYLSGFQLGRVYS